MKVVSADLFVYDTGIAFIHSVISNGKTLFALHIIDAANDAVERKVTLHDDYGKALDAFMALTAPRPVVISSPADDVPESEVGESI